MGLRAVTYARQSLDRTGEGAGVNRQIEACRQLAAARGWDIVAEHIDNDVSASSGKRRPQFDAAMTALEDGQADALICWHIDRLTRSMTDLEHIVALCEKTGARIATASGDVDLSTDAGRLVGRILAAVARAEVERKATRQRLANEQRAGAGTMTWTRRPYGYRLQDGTQVIDPAEADVIRDLATRFLDGAPLGDLATRLNAAGLTTTTGAPWHTTAVRRAISSPRVAGLVSHRGQVVRPGTWPAILDRDTWDAVTARLADPRRRTQRGTRPRYLLSGIAVCGVCGGPCFSRNFRTQPPTYACKNGTCVTRNIERVDTHVTAILLAVLADPRNTITRGDDLDRLYSAVTELRDRRDGIGALLADGLLSTDAAKAQASKLTGQITDLERQIAAGLGDPSAAHVATSDDPAAAWAALPIERRRAIVRATVKVRIDPLGAGGYHGGAVNVTVSPAWV